MTWEDLNAEKPTPGAGRHLGMVMAGSLSEGLLIRLDAEVSVEDMAVGRYVTIEGQRRRFFGLISDVRLESSDPRLAASPPDVTDDFIAEVIAGTSTYGTLEIVPMLVVDRDAVLPVESPQPVKTVPSHFAVVHEASEQDVALIFGEEDDRHFYLGTPLDMEAKVCLDLKRFVERSSGVFGKSGTGKTFLTRLLLIGLVQKSEAVSLVFDMHNEYGWEGTFEGGAGKVKALKQLFGSRVAIFTLDEHSSRNRGATPDYVVEIGYDQVEPEDLALLREALGMTDAQIESVQRLARRLGEQRWLEAFLGTEAAEREQLAQDFGLNPSTLHVLHRKLDTRLARLPFLKPRAAGDSLQMILNYLRRGVHVVLEFGRHSSLDAYILVANVLTRRIHEQYVEAVDRSMGDASQKPRPLVIVIEEAHKFLNPQVAGQTIFGTIAREMRKYNVTLLVVDQRPSGIDEEVMSQIGTRITCLLDNERDIDSVLMGMSGRSQLRAVLAKLETKQQALIFGHAVPMPVVVRTREYGPETYPEFGFREASALKRQAQQDIKDIWGE